MRGRVIRAAGGSVVLLAFCAIGGHPARCLAGSGAPARQNGARASASRRRVKVEVYKSAAELAAQRTSTT